MAQVTYKNKTTGKTHTTTSEGVKLIKGNPVLAKSFVFEAEEEKPKEPKTAAAKSEEK